MRLAFFLVPVWAPGGPAGPEEGGAIPLAGPCGARTGRVVSSSWAWLCQGGTITRACQSVEMAHSFVLSLSPSLSLSAHHRSCLGPSSLSLYLSVGPWLSRVVSPALPHPLSLSLSMSLISLTSCASACERDEGVRRTLAIRRHHTAGPQKTAQKKVPTFFFACLPQGEKQSSELFLPPQPLCPKPESRVRRAPTPPRARAGNAD